MARKVERTEISVGDSEKRTPTVRAEAGLNIRVGPHKSYPSLGILPDGAEVELLELPGGVKVPGWYLATTQESTGWVDTDFIALPEAE